MNELNCPNCGAPITGVKCEYCGTVFRKPEKEVLYADDIPIMTVDKLDDVISLPGVSINEKRRAFGLPAFEGDDK